MRCEMLPTANRFSAEARNAAGLSRFGISFASILFLLLALGATRPASAQSLNWEGQDGVFVTPLAYAVPSNDKGFGRPMVAYHYLDGGTILGGFHQVSVTMGAWNILEFG